MKERFVYGEGQKPNDVMLLGQNPGKTEFVERRPFAGKSGAILDTCLQVAGIPRHSVYITNAFKLWLGRDRFGNDIAPREDQVADHAPLLEHELKKVQPRFIGTIGAVATHIFLPGVSMEAAHGLPHMIDGRCVVPIVHPAAGMRPGGELLAVWSFQDIKTFGEIVRGKRLPFRKVHPSPPSKWIDDKSHTGTVYASPGVDTEGDKRDPFCMSFATSEEEGRVVRPEHVKKFRFVKSIVLHYALHDMPVLRRMGLKLRHLQIIDTMVKAYVLGEPQSLKDLTFRFLGYKMPEYKEVVRDAYQKELRGWLEKALEHEWEAPEPSLKRDKHGKWKMYQPQPVKGRLVRLQKDLATEGKTVDLEKRIKALGDHIPRIEKKAGPLMRMSQALKLLPPAESATYAGRDACNTLAINRILDARLEALGLAPVAEMDCSILPMLDRMQSNGMRCDLPYMKTLQLKSEKTMLEIEKEISSRWFGRRINLRSPDQVRELLFSKLHLRPIMFTKKGLGSTNKKTLEALKDQHVALTLVRQHRLAEANHKFTVSLPKFANSDGDIFGTFKYTRIVSGRVAMEKPTMQNIPTRTEEGRAIRDAFVARPGLVFGSWDYDQIEMKVMAHLSQDPKLVKYLKQGLDIHIKTASLIFGVKEPDVSKVQRTVTKNINYGLLFMIQERGLHDQLRLVGIHEYSVDDCRRLIQEWFRIYSRVQDFREECIAKARRRGFAQSMWGRPRWLPALYWPIDHLRYEAERQAVSHEISSSAQDVIKRAMARLWIFLREQWRSKVKIEPLLQIHDELLFEIDPKKKHLGKTIRQIMCQDSKAFSVPITSSEAFGERWGALKG